MITPLAALPAAIRSYDGMSKPRRWYYHSDASYGRGISDRSCWQVETGDTYISSSLWQDDSYTQGCRNAHWLADKGQISGFSLTCMSTMATISSSTVIEHHGALLFQNILVHHILYIH
jgi:hypothetical protein